MTYYLNLFTVETWKEFKAAGSGVTGFRSGSWPRMRNLQVGDRFVCYLAGAYRWIAVLEITGEPYLAIEGTDREIWSMDFFPARVPVEVVVEVDPIYGPSVQPMLDELEAAKGLSNRNRWGSLFMGSMRSWPEADGKLVEHALDKAFQDPVEHELPASAFQSHSTEIVETDQGVVTVPLDEEDTDAEDTGGVTSSSTHTEMQALLAKIGHGMHFQVYIAQGDRGREWNGVALGEMPGTTASLPLPFPEAALRVIRHIDVLWLDGDMIRAAWEVERTTSIFSGLLRMTDLLALQPNLSMPMFLVAPESRREKVAAQLFRPTFARMRPQPLADLCQFVSFEALRSADDRAGGEWRYTMFEFISEQLAEWLDPVGV